MYAKLYDFLQCLSENQARESCAWMSADDIAGAGESCGHRGSVQSVSATNKTTAEVLLVV